MSAQVHFKRKRTTPFSIRFSDEERARVEARAGAMPVGAYIKSVVLSEDAPRYRKRRAMPEADQRLLAEILARLGASRSASNLNQIAKHLNQGTLIFDAELKADLKLACAEVAWIRTTLMGVVAEL
jgi:hypothetical protein